MRRGWTGLKLSRAPAPRIFVNDHALDEVEVRVPTPEGARSLATVRYPSHRHSAYIDGDLLTLSIQAIVVVQLYFDRVLPADRSSPVAIRIGDTALGRFLLERVEAGPESTTIDHPALLRFRRVGEESARGGA